MAPSFIQLESKGVEVEEDPDCITPLPPYVKDLRRMLLNFREIVPHNCKLDLEDCSRRDKHLLNNKFPLKDYIYCDARHPIYRARWEAALDLRDKARNMRNKEREKAWDDLIGSIVFESFNHQASEWVNHWSLSTSGKTNEDSHGILLKDLLSSGADELFSNAVAIRGRFPDGKEYLPKPDRWFGLGLYKEGHLSRLKGLEIKDKGIEYFTKEKLADISKEENPVGGSTPHAKRLIYQPGSSKKDGAFPWIIVELKKEDGDENECISQAANTSYTSLKLCERLAASANRKDVPPIIAFTSVGPKAKMFVAYKSKGTTGKKIYRFSCIWSGNFEHIWHALQLLRIVDQLLYWGLRVFKPWVTECLEHWFQEETEDDSDDETEDESESETDDRFDSEA